MHAKVKLVMNVLMAAAVSASDRFAIVGYAPDYRLGSLDLTAVGANLTDLILFSVSATPTSTVDPGSVTQMDHMRAFRAKKANPRLRVLISLGGGGRSASLPTAVASKGGRETLAKALLKYVRKAKLDGLDIDWEAPLGTSVAGQYVAFLEQTRALFDAATPPLLLTMAIHAEHAESLAAAYAHVHRVHLMSYDMPDKRSHAAPPAARAAVDRVLQAGCPREKLTLGLPFYGRSLAMPGQTATYEELLAMRARGEAGGTARDDRINGFAFDSAGVAALKVEMAAALGLAGVMAWEAAAVETSAAGWAPGQPDAARLDEAEAQVQAWEARSETKHDEL